MMLVLALLAAALQPPPQGWQPARTPFVAMLSEARVEAHCYQTRCPAVPITYDPAELPSDPYSIAFRGAVVRFLLEVRYRGLVDEDFTPQDRSKFEVSLNVLQRYLTCLEEGLMAGNEADYTDRASVDRLATRASEACKDERDAGLRRIDFDGPDFVAFDLLRDGDRPNAEVSELLQKVQHFAIAYHAGRRGVQWSHAVALQSLPKALSAAERAEISE